MWQSRTNMPICRQGAALGQVLKGEPQQLARRLMAPSTRGIAPLLRGGRPPVFRDGVCVDQGEMSGIDRLLLVLAS